MHLTSALLATLFLSLPQATASTAGSLPAGGPQPQEGSIPPGEAEARERLNTSPRHGEWVAVEAAGGDRLNAWVVYPERSDDAPVVVVIHEIFGLTDWIRSVADQLAADGFIAIAPDLLSGKGPDGGGSESVDRDGAVRLVRSLDPAEVVARLNATARHGTSLEAARDAYAGIGFCWGGSTSFRWATRQPGLAGAVVYYGSSPDEEALKRVEVPVLGLYGGDDRRVNATIPRAETVLGESGSGYDAENYEGAGHGFLRAQEGREGANLRAARQAWPRTVGFLREVFGEM